MNILKKYNNSVNFWNLVFLAAGTMIGSTVLTLPLEISPYGWHNVLLLMLMMCFYSFYVAMYTVEANLFHKMLSIGNVDVQNQKKSNKSCSEESMNIAYLAQLYLGKFAAFLSIACTAGLFFALLSAYISGISSMISVFFDTDFKTACIMTGIVSGVLITFKHCSPIVNKFLFLLKIFAFAILIAYCIVNFSSETLMTHAVTVQSIDMGKILPLFFTAFGFHGSIPCIMKLHFATFDDNTFSVSKNFIKTLKKVFLVSSLIALSVYLIWIFIVFSNIASDQVIPGSNISDLINLLTGANVDSFSHYFNIFVKIFAFCALMTSIIGVGFGLVDFVKEILSGEIEKMQIKYCHNTQQSRDKCEKYNRSNKTYVFSAFFVFSICTFISFGARFLFIKFLSFAALCLLFIAVIIPCLIVFKQRYVLNNDFSSSANNFIASGGKNFLIFNLLIGIMLAVIDCYFIFF